jgi:hypothetical protein
VAWTNAERWSGRQPEMTGIRNTGIFCLPVKPIQDEMKLTLMLELEVYAAGLRNLEKILELDLEFESVPSLRYKVDTNHDIVYMEFEEPTLTIQEIRAIFRKLNLDAKVVGTIPLELNPKSKTQLLGTV